MKKKIIISCIVIIQIIVLMILVMGRHSDDTLVIHVPYQDLNGTTIPVDQNGWYIDEEMPCLEDGLFDYSNSFALTANTYRITINYETNTDNNTSTVSATTEGLYGVLADQTPLPSGLSQISYTIYLLEDTQDFCVKNYYGKTGYLIIRDIEIQRTHGLWNMKIFIWMLLSLLVDSFLIFQQIITTKWYKNRVFYLGILGIALLASMPSWDGAMVDSQDLAFHLIRIEGIKTALLHGQFPVKIQSVWQYGYGYPFSLYYGDMFLVFPAILRMIGFPVNFSFNITMFMTNLATAGIAYWCSHKICKNQIGSLACALAYTMFPYRITDMYYRNSVGEIFAYTFLPLLIYGFLQIYTLDRNSKELSKQWIVLVIGFTGVIQSHMLTCVMIAELVVVLCVVMFQRTFQKERFWVLFKAAIYSALVNAWFLFPNILAMDNICVLEENRYLIRIQQTGISLRNLFSLGKVEGSCGGAGIAIAILLLTFCIVCWKIENQEVKKLGVIFWWITVILLLFTTRYFPWNMISSKIGRANIVLANIQFTTRWLCFASAFSIYLMAYLFKMTSNYCHNCYTYFIVAILSVLLIITGDNYMKTSMNTGIFYIKDITAYGKMDYNLGEYLPIGTNPSEMSIGRMIPENENVTYAEYNREDTSVELYCKNTNAWESYLDIPVIMYPQYEAYDENNQKMQLTYGTNNAMRIMLPSGYEGKVKIKYVHQLSWRLFELLSIISLIGIIVFEKRINGQTSHSCFQKG